MPHTFRVQRIVGALATGSSRPLLVETDGGRFVVKLVHGPDGPRALAAEWICTALAVLIGLPALELAVLELDGALGANLGESELSEAVLRGAGTCLGLRELPGARLAPPNELARAGDEFALPVLWLDILVENPDRRHDNPNVLSWGSSLIPIDYAASLPFQHAFKLSEQSPHEDLKIPEAHIFADRAAKLRSWHSNLADLVSRDKLEAICLSLPAAWLGPLCFATPDRQRRAYAAYLWKRLRGMGRL